MIQKQAYACYATHDQYLIDRIIEIIKDRKLNTNQFEFQVLYGVPMAGRLEELAKNGYKVRVYVPFGSEWYEYSLRRLKENPNIVGYVLKNLLSKTVATRCAISKFVMGQKFINFSPWNDNITEPF